MFLIYPSLGLSSGLKLFQFLFIGVVTHFCLPWLHNRVLNFPSTVFPSYKKRLIFPLRYVWSAGSRESTEADATSGRTPVGFPCQ